MYLLLDPWADLFVYFFANRKSNKIKLFLKLTTIKINKKEYSSSLYKFVLKKIISLKKEPQNDTYENLMIF